MSTCSRVTGVLCLVTMAALPVGAQTTAPTGKLRVTVVDQTGGVLPAATVVITGQDDAMRKLVTPAIASGVGVATFDALAPGRYTLQVEFPGFEPATVRDVRVRAGENRRRVTLQLQKHDEQVTIAREAQAASLDPIGATFSTVLTREMIEALPDDPDEMEAALLAMAPPGAKFKVDGFSGGVLPRKALIKSVRVPRMDEMAAQNHGGKDGFLFIDIKTQPGAGPLRGSLDGSFFDDMLSARNPFTPVKGDEQNRGGSFFLARTIVPNKSSFSVNVGSTSGYTSPNLLAVLPDGTTWAESLKRPAEGLTFGIRVDQALNADHSLRVSFDRRSGKSQNNGIGGFNLPERAFSATSSSYALRLSEAGPVGRRMFTESRLQLSWSSSQTQAAVEMPATRVLDAFTSGGGQVKGGQDAFAIEAASDLDYVRGSHSWRVGGLLEGGRYRSDDMTNYLGTYVFPNLAAFNAGKPMQYSRRIGDPNVTYSAWQAGVYFQDDWRVARNALISAGVRAGFQTLASDQFNLSPRLTVSWSPFRDGRLTLRSAYGYLYDWIEGALYKQTLLVDGFRLKELNLTNPSYPDPPSSGSTSVTNRYLWSDDLTLPISHRLNLGADQRITANMRVNAGYTFGWGGGLLRGRNLNAPVNGVRPDAQFANVVQLVPDAEGKAHMVNLGWSLTKPNWKRLNFYVNYTWAISETNTTGPFSLPASSDNLDTEWGPNRARHSGNVMMNIAPIENLNLNLSAKGVSGSPYNITTGYDDNGDGVFNDRPAGVSRNSARTAAQWDLNGKLSYAWRFGPPRVQDGGGGGKVAGPGEGKTAGPGDGKAAAPRGGQAVPRFRIVLSLSGQNLLNRANYVGYSGVMTSPFFGKPTNVLNPRRLQMALRFEY